MSDRKRRGIALIVALGLLAMSGIALAQPDPGDIQPQTHQEPDTVFHFGYDPDSQVLVYGIFDLEDAEACALPGEDSNGGEECELSEVQVTGPNGQINHGMFMKAFNSVFQGTGRGCLVRHLAKSTLGMDDQQVNVPDVDPDLEPEVTGSVEFSTAVTKCQHGKGSGNGNGNGNGDGPPAHAASEGKGRPESPGKSGDAPGRNK